MNMNWEVYILAGFVATVVLTTSLALFRGVGLTRLDFMLVLGTIFTFNRDLAKAIGFVLHFFFGWVFAFVYIAVFIQMKEPSFVLLGALFGLVHGLFLLSVGMWLLPSIHPRMASEDLGPEPTRQLEPPGYMALNYGRHTPVVTVLAHMLYGAILGWLYH